MDNAHVSLAKPDLDAMTLMRRGYDDMRKTFDFDPDYDTWDEVMQRNYEIGRMMAAIIRGYGKTRFRWRPEERGGQMFRRLLGEAVGRAEVKELNVFIARDTR